MLDLRTCTFDEVKAEHERIHAIDVDALCASERRTLGRDWKVAKDALDIMEYELVRGLDTTDLRDALARCAEVAEENELSENFYGVAFFVFLAFMGILMLAGMANA